MRGDAVRLLTAHRSKGLEWRLVVVAHVQEEGWPDLRRRSTLLQADRIGADGLLPPLTVQALLAEERRLFYVACTRARERLVVTAVASPDDDGEQPSRFVDELAAAQATAPRLRPAQPPAGPPARPLSLAGLVAELRRTARRPDTLAGAAARGRRPARACSPRPSHRGQPLVPPADPARGGAPAPAAVCATARCGAPTSR